MCILLASFVKVVAMDVPPSVRYNKYKNDDDQNIKKRHAEEKKRMAVIYKSTEYMLNKDDGNIKYTKNSHGGGGGVKRRLEYSDEGSRIAKETKANNN